VKNLSLALNAVLLVAVGILYYLHFSKSKEGLKESTESADTTKNIAPVPLPEIRTSNGAIAYINYDSLTEKYQFYKDGMKNLESNLTQKENEFQKKQESLRQEMERYQQLAPSLSEESRARKEQELMKQQEQLMILRETLTEELRKLEGTLSKKFLTNIDDYLRQLSKEKNYSYVFTYSKGGPATIVYANDSLEITREVILGLNKAYKAKKSK
jgi:outer membrane protein